MQDQGKEIQLNAWEDTKKRLKTWLKMVTRKVLGVGIPAWNLAKTYVAAPYILSNHTATVEAMERKVSGYLRKWL